MGFGGSLEHWMTLCRSSLNVSAAVAISVAEGDPPVAGTQPDTDTGEGPQKASGNLAFRSGVEEGRGCRIRKIPEDEAAGHEGRQVAHREAPKPPQAVMQAMNWSDIFRAAANTLSFHSQERTHRQADDSFKQAIRLHQSGQKATAEQNYTKPQSARADHLGRGRA